MTEQSAQREILFNSRENPELLRILWVIMQDSGQHGVGRTRYGILYDARVFDDKKVDEILLELEEKGIIVKKTYQTGTAGTSQLFYKLNECDIKFIIQLKS